MQAAEGFLDLGMPEEAESELAEIGEAAVERADYWRLAAAVSMARKRWEEGAIRAGRLVALSPDSPDGYFHAAFCLHELGQTEAARNLLEKGPARLKASPIYFYNLACYEAQLGNLERARSVLAVAIRMQPAYRQIAREDPDLAPLR